VAGVTLACGSRTAAEDAVQEALARAWERSERGEQIESLRAWVAKVAINLVRSGFRRMLAERRARERLVAGRTASDHTFGPSVAGAEDALDIERALARLPRRQREATVLRYYLDMPVIDVAHVLGVNEGTAKTTLFRARKALSIALGEPATEHHEEAEGVART
jgi:RNA polymerase sigma-70 factor (ECF subfamily)